MSRGNEETNGVLARRDAARAQERTRLAARPANNWIVIDRFKLEASADDAPEPMPEKPEKRKGRVRKKRVDDE
jgi:hypothetical protein